MPKYIDDQYAGLPSFNTEGIFPADHTYTRKDSGPSSGSSTTAPLPKVPPKANTATCVQNGAVLSDQHRENKENPPPHPRDLDPRARGLKGRPARAPQKHLSMFVTPRPPCPVPPPCCERYFFYGKDVGELCPLGRQAVPTTVKHADQNRPPQIKSKPDGAAVGEVGVIAQEDGRAADSSDISQTGPKSASADEPDVVNAQKNGREAHSGGIQTGPGSRNTADERRVANEQKADRKALSGTSRPGLACADGADVANMRGGHKRRRKISQIKPMPSRAPEIVTVVGAGKDDVKTRPKTVRSQVETKSTGATVNNNGTRTQGGHREHRGQGDHTNKRKTTEAATRKNKRAKPSQQASSRR